MLPLLSQIRSKKKGPHDCLDGPSGFLNFGWIGGDVQRAQAESSSVGGDAAEQAQGRGVSAYIRMLQTTPQEGFSSCFLCVCDYFHTHEMGFVPIATISQYDLQNPPVLAAATSLRKPWV